MVFQFNPQSYGNACAALLECREPCELGAGTPNRSALEQLSALDEAALSGGGPVQDRGMASCCISALWLLHNYLDESHQISQNVHSNTGSYWHAIMHRREGDFPNSKYWFRRTGSHPVFEQLVEAARELARESSTDLSSDYLIEQTCWDPDRFVDMCASAPHHSSCEALVRQTAQLEWQLLFDFCYRQALGTSS